jgi:hypothetical protein
LPHTSFIPERRLVLLIVGVALFLLIVVNSGTTLSIWLTLLLRPFMHGVSLFKIDFLLLFLILAGIGTLTGPIVRTGRTLTVLLWTTLGSVTVGCGVGMATFLSLADQLHLPLAKYAYFFSDGYNSINQFAHLHVTKTGLFHLLSWLGLGRVAEHADAGKPFVEYIHPGITIVVLVAAAVACFALLMAAATVVRSWPGLRQVTALILFSLAGSHTVKCIIDGGLLAYDFLPSVMTVGLMILHARGQDLWSMLRQYWLRLVLVVALFLALISIFSLDVALVLQPQQYGFFFGIYLLFMAVLVFDVRRGVMLGIITVPCLMWCGLYYYLHTAPDIQALSRRVSSDDRVYVHNLTGSAEGYSSQTVSEVTPLVTGERVIDVYRRNGQNPLRNRALMIKSRELSQYAGLIFALRILRADSVVSFESTKYLTIRGVTTAGNANDSVVVFRVDFNPEIFPSMWQASSTILDENNRFAMLYFLDQYFALRGLRDYVLIPMYYEEAACHPLEG